MPKETIRLGSGGGPESSNADLSIEESSHRGKNSVLNIAGKKKEASQISEKTAQGTGVPSEHDFQDHLPSKKLHTGRGCFSVSFVLEGGTILDFN